MKDEGGGECSCNQMLRSRYDFLSYDFKYFTS